jgi:hypothetical protein
MTFATATVIRTQKGRIRCEDTTYARIPYDGFVTTFEGNILYDKSDRLTMENARMCWEAQDVIPAGIYNGVDRNDPPRGARKHWPYGLWLSDAPVRPSGSTIWIHYGTGYADGGGNAWTTGCIVFPQAKELVPRVDTPQRASVVEVINQFAISQDFYSISGRVLDQDNRPVEGAEIRVIHGNQVYGPFHTNSAGRYLAVGFPAGLYTVELSKPGYKFALDSRVLNVAERLPWLSNATREQATVSVAWPPDCYGVEFRAHRERVPK